MTNALITGITGQDGSYLAEFLLKRDYKVYGLIRRSSAGPNLQNIEHIKDDIQFLQGDMTDGDSLKRAVQESNPDEIYNLAAQSFVPMSWASPTYTVNCNLGGFIYLLEAVRDFRGARLNPIKVYQASTSEMYGNHDDRIRSDGIYPALNEYSRMNPRSPYGVSKLGAHRMAQVYRESFDMFVSCGILFNHESPRRGKMFVTRKITSQVAEIIFKKREKIQLGNINARRDWGYAGDYVRAMWLMLQQEEPSDYVIGTGESFSIRDCVIQSFIAAKELVGNDVSIENVISKYVEIDEQFVRPAEINVLMADYSKAEAELGWKPTVRFPQLIKKMVKHDLEQEGIL